MDKNTVVALTAIAVCAVIAPALADLLKRTRIPEVVILLVLGIIVGPQVLNVAEPNIFIAGLSELGLAFLMFLAGYEINLQRIKGRPLGLAATGWVLSVLLALGIAAIFVSTGEALDTMVLGIALTTTALGTLLPILRDAGLLPTALGTHVLAIGTMGEFGPIIAISVLLTPTRHDLAFVLLLAFVIVAVGAAVVATRARPPRLLDLAQRHLETSSQFPVRVSFLLIMVLVLLATELKLDILMGSFSAGLVFRLMIDEDETHTVHRKLEAIGYGFLIPVFFVVSGMRFDFRALFSTPTALLRVPLFLVLFLVVRGLPALLLYRRDVPLRGRAALAFFSSTALPLVVVITDLGVSTGRMRPVNAAALVAAAIISVLVYPLLGLALDRRQSSDAVDAGSGQVAPS
jgi:Kef-type K+ transport system membrane component KefB